MTRPVLRRYRSADAGALARVFHLAVRRGTAPQYSWPQRLAWSPRVRPAAAWDSRLSEIHTVVAETEAGLVGFMAMDPADGFFDFAYVAPSHRGTGVGGGLYALLEGRARMLGRARLETAASRVAEPFFARRGWQVVRRQTVRRLGVDLPNAVMEKRLIAQGHAA